MEKGKLIGRGRTAEVFEWGEDKVVKLFMDWYKEDWIIRDAKTEDTVFKSGLPCPGVFGIVEVEGLKGIVYQRIDGKTMLNNVSEKPIKILSCGKDLAQLHYEMHRVQVEGLVPQLGKMVYSISATEKLSEDQKKKIIEKLSNLPHGQSVCHGDFHPDNIMQNTAESLIIDWSTVTVGNPLSDVARTCLILSSPYLPLGMSKVTVALIKMSRKMIKSSYLKHYIKLAKVKRKDIDVWILPHAAARLIEEVTGEEKWLLKLINQQLG